MQAKPCSAIVNNPATATPYQPYVDQQQFKRFAASYGHCVEYLPGETYIDKTEDDDKGQDTIEVTELVVFPCSLATGCITTGFPKIQIEIAIPSVSTNMNNYESPVSKLMTVEKYSQSVQLGQSQRTLYRLAANEIWDDQNVPWKKASRKFSYNSIDKSSYSVEERDKTQSLCTDTTILDGSCEGFTTFEFQTTARKYLTTRQYKGFTRTLSELGGLNAGALYFCLYLTAIYCYYAKKKMLVDSVFEFFAERRRRLRYFKLGGSQVQNENLKDQPNKDTNPLYSMTDAQINQMSKDAYEVIINSLDIITLIREINNLKVLTGLLLSDYHQKLVPLIALNIENKKAVENKKKLAKIKSPTSDMGSKELGFQRQVTFDERSGQSKTGLSTMTFNRALAILIRNKNNAMTKTQHDRTLKQKQEVDLFCYEGLKSEKDENVKDNINYLEIIAPEVIDSLGVALKNADINRVIMKGVKNMDNSNREIGDQRHIDIDKLSVAKDEEKGIWDKETPNPKKSVFEDSKPTKQLRQKKILINPASENLAMASPIATNNTETVPPNVVRGVAPSPKPNEKALDAQRKSMSGKEKIRITEENIAPAKENEKLLIKKK